MAQKKSFARNVVFEQGKKIYLFAISIVYTCVIASFLGPADYGLVTYFIGFVGSATNMCGVLFIQGLISWFMPRYKSRSLFRLAIKYQYLILLPVVAVLFVFAEPIIGFLQKDSPLLFRAASLLFLIMPLYMSHLYMIRAFKRFGKTFKAEALMSSINLIVAFSLIYFLGVGAMSVVVAQAIAASAAIVVMIRFARELNFQKVKPDKEVLVKCTKSALPLALIARGFDTFQLIVIGIFVNNVLLGYYYIVQKMTNVFIGTSTSTIQDVLMPYSVEKRDDKKTLGNFVSLTIKFSLIFSIIVGLAIIVVSRPLLEWFLPEYVNAFPLIPISLAVVIVGSLKTLGNIFISLNEMKFILIANAISVAIGIPLAYYLIATFEAFGIFYLLFVMSVVKNSMLYYYTKKVGVKVQVIPRYSDLRFFYYQAISFLKDFPQKRKMK